MLIVPLVSLMLTGLSSIINIAAAKASVRVRAGGSSLPASVFKVWKPVYQAYRSLYSSVDVSYEILSSALGFQKFVTRDWDYSGLAEDLTVEQRTSNRDYQLFPAFAMPLVVVYNVPELSAEPAIPGDRDERKALGNLKLTRDNLVGIFNGSITHWNDTSLVANNRGLADVNESIVIVVRFDTAAITGIFTQALEAFARSVGGAFPAFSEGCTAPRTAQKWNPSINLQCRVGTWGVSSFIINTKYSIGILVASDARDMHLPDAHLQNLDGNWVRGSVITTQAAMDNVSAELGPSLAMSLVNIPGPISYPIAGYLYILIRLTTMENCTIAMELYRMFSYLLEDNLSTSIVAEMINVPLSQKVLALIKRNALGKMKCSGAWVSDLVAVANSIEDGSYDAWKRPVIIVCALVLMVLAMALIFYLSMKYMENRSALRNTFIIRLNLAEVSTKSTISVTSIGTMTSKPQSRDTYEWTADAGSSAVKVKSGEQLLLRKLCMHLLPETMAWPTRLAMVRLREKIVHLNVLRLQGLALHDGRWSLVSGCPSKGRLQDILHTGKYHLDAVFRYSILNDTADAMIYLHKNDIIHGQLTSNCCYIDTRWNVVVGDWEQFVLHEAQKVRFIASEGFYDAASRETSETGSSSYTEYLRSLYWSSPEAMTRDSNDLFIVSQPTKPADVYSYSIIAFEILTDLQPYENTTLHDPTTQPYHILTSVKMDGLRPTIPVEAQPGSGTLTKLITSGWQRNAEQRPTFSDISRLIKQANPKNRSIIDSMMQAMENYAVSLEEKVAERTRELERLTKNMESLLHSMLPATIADKLAKGRNVEPEFYDSSTVFFSDIVGFTTIAANSSPIDIVNLLNDLYSAFDGVIKRFDVYKVETIGDSYMCVSGLPNRNGLDHAHQIASMSLELLYTVTTIPIRTTPEKSLLIRVGAHSGAVVAGVVGITMPRYCIFGDTVNTASRMESSSLPMRIQISHATWLLLSQRDVYTMICRGDYLVKGKGLMKTYWLTGKTDCSHPLPVFDASQDEQLLLLLDDSQIK